MVSTGGAGDELTFSRDGVNTKGYRPAAGKKRDNPCLLLS